MLSMAAQHLPRTCGCINGQLAAGVLDVRPTSLIYLREHLPGLVSCTTCPRASVPPVIMLSPPGWAKGFTDPCRQGEAGRERTTG